MGSWNSSAFRESCVLGEQSTALETDINFQSNVMGSNRMANVLDVVSYIAGEGDDNLAITTRNVSASVWSVRQLEQNPKISYQE